MAELSLKTRGELWLANWIRRFYIFSPRFLEDTVPQRFRTYEIGFEGKESISEFEKIPPIVWAYWNGSHPPLLIKRCFENWRQFNPAYTIRILDDISVGDYLPDLMNSLAQIPVARRSDWIRLELLHRYGGIWLDASTILTESLDWILAEQIETQSEFVGYYIGAYTKDLQCPVIESWCMAAPAGSSFIRGVLFEFANEAITRGGHGYVEHLQNRGIYDRVRQNIDMPEYLSIHLAMQVVLRKGGKYTLCLGKAEEGPFLLHVLGNWDRTPLKIRLMFSKIRGVVPSLIKLRNPDRKRLDEYLLRGLYVKDSIFDRFLRNR
ncbi:MAG: capsular polysaccharide synthesis protein [Oxalicibacterium faecigallinarum]|uniref:glycosyltransferase family 32 protein n=1 Tax=Oxalicibacterium faecigallinarum TaxID=573741 RepID=UPI002806B867|nr:capsular polysaccharide synthesis protein [Oxalicibacterium faecigallinarum]MDQ7969985.1 capsular polysaccharide synthesis protein [Oxalicibacterium faecigallinarum]